MKFFVGISSIWVTLENITMSLILSGGIALLWTFVFFVFLYWYLCSDNEVIGYISFNHSYSFRENVYSIGKRLGLVKLKHHYSVLDWHWGQPGSMSSTPWIHHSRIHLGYLTSDPRGCLLLTFRYSHPLLHQAFFLHGCWGSQIFMFIWQASYQLHHLSSPSSCILSFDFVHPNVK